MISAARDAIARRLRGGLLGAIAMVAAGAAATRLAATVKDFVVARQFGTSESLDAFLLAFALPVFFAGAFRSAFYAAFVPRFLEARARRGPEGASSLLSRVLPALLLILAVLAVSLALFATPIVALVAHGFPPAKRAMTRDLLIALAPFVILDGASGIYTATLNACGRFVAATLIATIPPLITLGAVATAAAQAGVWTLAGGAVVGAAIEAAVAIVLVRREGLRVAPVFGPGGSEAQAVLRGFAILASGGVVMSANTVIDQAMAATTGGGSVAAIGFGTKVPSALLGLAGLALNTTILPYYVELAARRQWDAMARALRRHAVLIGLVAAASAAALAAVSTPLTRLLFQRGAFGPEDTSKVAAIQAVYALQLPGYLIAIVASRFLNALGRDRTIFAVSVSNFVLNAVGNWVFLRWIGLPGIALSTSFFYTVAAAVLLILCRRALREARARQTP